MTSIRSSLINLFKPCCMAPREPDATTSRAQAQEGSTFPRLLPRDNPSRALRQQHKWKQNSPLTMLPSDMQTEIVDRLDKRSMARLRLTCQDFEKVVSEHVRHVTVNNRKDLRQAMATYKDGEDITTLTLKGGSFTDDDLALLQNLPRLTHLDLSGCSRLTDAGLAPLQQLTSLRHLDLAGCKNLTGAGLAHLQPLASLQHLNLQHCYSLNNAGLAPLRQLTSLRHLDLAGCKNLTDAGLAHLQPLASLQHLYLSGCLRLTDAGLEHLQPLASLQHLDLSGCRRLTDAGRSFLRNRIGERLEIRGN